ncbi:hypothetical protein CQ042_05530 [Microbacterium sp. MYb62]|nr:hypothetical protein CQ042_05530 [Microbacterium sp. MYb62]
MSLPEQNQALWVMPLDQYMVSQVQIKREAYLHALISQECLTGQGFEQTVPSPDLTDDGTESSVRNRFDEGVAAKFGYHLPAESSPADDVWFAYTRRPMSDTELAALDGCVRDLMADEDVPKWGPRTLDYSPGIAQAAILGAREDPTVADSAKEWAACMAPLGVSDLPSTPASMPSESMKARYGWANFSEVDSSPPLTSAEISDAVADARCRESSGYSAALYQAEWSRQVDLLQSNAAALEDLRKEISATDAEMIERVATLVSSS